MAGDMSSAESEEVLVLSGTDDEVGDVVSMNAHETGEKE
jgi:hypothetical protein